METSQPIALVTGAGSGIGRHVALALFNAGYAVALGGRRMSTLEVTASMGPRHARSLLIALDVGNPAEVDVLFDRIRRTFGRLDVLFNNAGVPGPQVALDDIKYEDWCDTVKTNLTGAFLCAQGALRLMKAQTPTGGRIINNGSIAAHAPRPKSAAYTATKHAITGLTKSLALEGRPFRIACGQIDIGNATTPMANVLGKPSEQANGTFQTEPLMEVDAVVRSVMTMVALPLDANIQFLTVMATNMPFIGRG